MKSNSDNYLTRGNKNFIALTGLNPSIFVNDIYAIMTQLSRCALLDMETLLKPLFPEKVLNRALISLYSILDQRIDASFDQFEIALFQQICVASDRLMKLQQYTEINKKLDLLRISNKQLSFMVKKYKEMNSMLRREQANLREQTSSHLKRIDHLNELIVACMNFEDEVKKVKATAYTKETLPQELILIGEKERDFESEEQSDEDNQNLFKGRQEMSLDFYTDFPRIEADSESLNAFAMFAGIEISQSDDI